MPPISKALCGTMGVYKKHGMYAVLLIWKVNTKMHGQVLWFSKIFVEKLINVSSTIVCEWDISIFLVINKKSCTIFLRDINLTYNDEHNIIIFLGYQKIWWKQDIFYWCSVYWAQKECGEKREEYMEIKLIKITISSCHFLGGSKHMGTLRKNMGVTKIIKGWPV